MKCKGSLLSHFISLQFSLVAMTKGCSPVFHKIFTTTPFIKNMFFHFPNFKDLILKPIKLCSILSDLNAKCSLEVSYETTTGSGQLQNAY